MNKAKEKYAEGMVLRSPEGLRLKITAVRLKGLSVLDLDNGETYFAAYHVFDDFVVEH